MSKISAAVVVFTLAIAGYFAIEHIKERTSYSAGATQEVDLIREMELNGIPEIEASHLDGKPFDNSKIKDKVVIVSFWASWCDPCVKEWPSMIKLVEHFKGKLALVAVSHDYTLEDINSFLNVVKARNRPNIEVLWDKDGLNAKKFGSSKLPENYIVGRDGKLIRKIVGVEQWYSPDAIEYFEGFTK